MHYLSNDERSSAVDREMFVDDSTIEESGDWMGQKHARVVYEQI